MAYISRHTQHRNSPIPWVLLLILSLLIGGFVAFPRYQSWADMSQKIEEMAKEKPMIEQQIMALQKQNESLESMQFTAGADAQVVDKQRLPEGIDTGKIAQLLEIFALQMDIHPQREMDVQKVSFSSVKASDTAKYSETQMVIQAAMDYNSLEDFTKYLQNSVTPKIIVGQSKSGVLSAIEENILRTQLLPVMHIDTLEMTYGRSENDPIQVRIIANVFHQ